MRRMLLLAMLLAGCTTPMATIPATPRAVEVTYETQPCFGTCPVYAVTLNNFGQPAVFDGRRHTLVSGRREFAASAAQFNAFWDALAEARMAAPKDYEMGGANCRVFITDQPGVAVTFRIDGGEPWTFRYNYGCRDPQNAKLAAGLRRAPELLPIGELIGKR